MTKVKICLADDHTLVREGLKRLLELSGPFEVVLEAQHGLELIEKLNLTENMPDIAVVDVSMPVMDGIETVKELAARYPKLPVVGLSHNDNYEVVFRMIDNGARAYLLKDCSADYMKDCLLAVYENGSYYDSFVMEKVMEHNKSQRQPEKTISVLPSLLSGKELEFVRLACSDDTYREIADKMNVSPRTIDGYRESVFEKTGVTSRVGLVLFALEHGIYTPRNRKKR